MLFFDLTFGAMEIPIMEVIATVAALTLGVGWPLSFLGYNLSICSSNLALIFSYFSINNYYDLSGKKSTFLISELDEEALIPFIIFWNFFTDFQRWNNRSPSMRRYIIRLKKIWKSFNLYSARSIWKIFGEMIKLPRVRSKSK